MYICVCECLLQNNIAGVPSSRAGLPSVFPSTAPPPVLVPAALGTLVVCPFQTKKKKQDKTKQNNKKNTDP